MELTNIDFLKTFDTYYLRQLCKENNIGKKYKGIPVYKLKKAEMIEYLQDNMPVKTYTKEDIDYLTEDASKNHLTTFEFIIYLKNKVKDLQVVNIVKQREIEELIFDLENAVIERDRLKREIKEYACTKTLPPPLEFNDISDDLKCPVCLEYKVNTLLTCTHVLCNECEKKLTECPICRQDIKKQIVRYFRM